MHIEDDLKLHSHCISELYEKEKTLRERQHDMKEAQLTQSLTIKQNSEHIMDIVKIIKETQSALSELKAKHEIFKRDKNGWQLAIEGLRHPKNWIPIIGLILLIESIKGLEIAKLIRYYTGI